MSSANSLLGGNFPFKWIYFRLSRFIQQRRTGKLFRSIRWGPATKNTRKFPILVPKLAV